MTTPKQQPVTVDEARYHIKSNGKVIGYEIDDMRAQFLAYDIYKRKLPFKVEDRRQHVVLDGSRLMDHHL